MPFRKLCDSCSHPLNWSVTACCRTLQYHSANPVRTTAGGRRSIMKYIYSKDSRYPILSLRTFLRFFAHVQLLPILDSGEETLVGGQAVMEGVMMRAPHSYCVSVRKPSGEIVSEEMPVERISEKYPWMKYPMLRGLGTLGQAMSLGMKALKFSANAALDDGKTDKPAEVSSWMMTVQVLFSV